MHGVGHRKLLEHYFVRVFELIMLGGRFLFEAFGLISFSGALIYYRAEKTDKKLLIKYQAPPLDAHFFLHKVHQFRSLEVPKKSR
jgi:hypothetical protein